MPKKPNRKLPFPLKFSLFCFLFFFLSSCAFFELPERTARDVGIQEKPNFDWLMADKKKRQFFPHLENFKDLREGLCPGLANVVRKGMVDACPIQKFYSEVKHNDPQEWQLVSEFLHLTDAQIRDESLYEFNPLDLYQFNTIDNLISVTIRRALVERFDSLTLASFLVGYGKGVEDAQRKQFIIHTGDLLDISMATELMEGMEVFRGAQKLFNETEGMQLKIFSVAGNHDGLVFGNLSDGQADGRGLDINKAEFIFAHLLEDPRQNVTDLYFGFGFGKNEILIELEKIRNGLSLKIRDSFQLEELEKLEKLKEIVLSYDLIYSQCKERLSATISPYFIDDKKKVYHFCALSVQVLDRLKKLKPFSDSSSEISGEAKFEDPLNMPLAYRKAIDFPGSLSELPLRFGYYSWCDYFEPNKSVVNCVQDGKQIKAFSGVRYIVLDTRNDFYKDGTMDWVQLGWVYNELFAALKNKEGVIIFSHDPPDELPGPFFVSHVEYGVLIEMLHAFPNVMAVFYGHDHKNENQPPTEEKHFASFQTGSLADFPQVAREVTIFGRFCGEIREKDNSDVKYPKTEMAEEMSEKRCNKLKEESKKGFQVRIESRFVRPRGDLKEKKNGFLIESILRASRRDSAKEDNTRVWRKALYPIIPKHSPLKGHKWPEGDNSIVEKGKCDNGDGDLVKCKEEQVAKDKVEQVAKDKVEDKTITAFPVIYFDDDLDEFPPSRFFEIVAEGLTEKINNTRKAFCLKAIEGFPQRDQKECEIAAGKK